MQLLGGQIVVPLNCPEVLATAEFASDVMRVYHRRLQQGLAALDIGGAVMGLYLETEDVKFKDPGGTLMQEAWIAFYGEGDYSTPFLEVGRVVEPVGTPLSLWLGVHSRRLSNDPASPGLRRLHDLVSRRVAECRGITEYGECWALGPRGLRAAVEQAFGEHTEES